MKQRLFKKGETIPQWILKTTPLNEKGVSKFGVDVELVINNKGRVFYPVNPIIEGEDKIMIISHMQVERTKNFKQIYVFTKPKKRVKKREKRKLYYD